MDGKVKEVQIKGMQNGFTEEIQEQEKVLIHKFSQREQHEEIFWNQKSRVKWLQERERNTSFFHKEAIQLLQGNHMARIKIEGHIVETEEDLELNLNSYFAKLLEEPYGYRDKEQREVLRHIPRVVTEEHKLLLLKPIKLEEVDTVIKKMENDKAPRPNGFTTKFFHAC